MIPDSEILRILCEVLTDLDVGQFTVKINHRKILDGIFEVCGVPEASIRPISSAVDKLDKLPWADVKKEMVEEKGLAPECADKIGEYVKLKGGRDLLEILKKDDVLTKNASASAGIKDMELLFDYLDVFEVTGKMSFDLSLARGLDYYTGIIYEAVTEKSAPPSKVYEYVFTFFNTHFLFLQSSLMVSNLKRRQTLMNWMNPPSVLVPLLPVDVMIIW